MSTLRATQTHDAGMMLDGGVLGEILLPNRYVPEGFEPGQLIEVCLLNDSEDRLVATTEKPRVMAGQFALLRVVDTNQMGAFVDWGMSKDLLVPFREQTRKLKVGDQVIVHVYLDQVSGRLVASTKLRKFLDETAPPSLADGAAVSLVIAHQTDLGTKAIVNDQFWGLIHSSTAGVPPYGTRCSGFVGRVRENGVVDLTFERPGPKHDATARLAARLASAEDGFLPLHDKSSPEEIFQTLGMSKKVFKQALGALYRERRVRLTDHGVYLLPDRKSTPSATGRP